MAKDDAKGVVNLRLTPEVLVRADALIKHLEHVQGRTCTRSDVLREAIARGLLELEGDRPHRERADADLAKEVDANIERVQRTLRGGT